MKKKYSYFSPVRQRDDSWQNTPLKNGIPCIVSAATEYGEELLEK